MGIRANFNYLLVVYYDLVRWDLLYLTMHFSHENWSKLVKTEA